MNIHSKIYIAGHHGMVGSAIQRKLVEKGFTNIIGKRSSELDLCRQEAVEAFFDKERPEYVFLAAAKVGGIHANNTYRAEFIYQNLIMETNIIHASHLFGVKKLMFLGSSCIYPKLAPQPLKEDSLLTGLLEETNEPYAIAKIAGIKMCEAYRDQYQSRFISVMPTNLYGPGDNYDLMNSHVLPALIRKIFLSNCLMNRDWKALRYNLKKYTIGKKDYSEYSEDEIQKLLEGFGIFAEKVEIWGTGSPLREFLHADDLASACVFLMENYEERELINIGCGEDQTIKQLALLIANLLSYKGELFFNPEKPDGTPRKLMDVGKLFSYGWKPTIGLSEGIRAVINDIQS